MYIGGGGFVGRVGCLFEVGQVLETPESLDRIDPPSHPLPLRPPPLTPSLPTPSPYSPNPPYTKDQKGSI